MMKAKIDRLGINGEGIFNIAEGEDKGKVAFVDFALPNEIVDCNLSRSYSKYCKYKLNSVDVFSGDRCQPKCKYFYACGGCDLQHMNADLQYSFKQKKILDVVSKIDGNIKNVDIIKENEFNYRNKMVFPFDYKEDKLVLGMFEKNSHNVVDIDKCLLASENINKFLQISKEYFLKESQKFLSIKKDILLKYLVVREIGSHYLVSIVVSKKYQFKEYYSVLIDALKNVGLSVIVGGNDNGILSGKYYPLYGKQTIDLSEFGVKYSIDIMSFLQVNNVVKQKLYQRVLSEINKYDVVIDAYSGAGLMSAILAKKCKQVIGLEINKFAHSVACKLSEDNNIKNMLSICGDAGNLLEKHCKIHKPQIIVLDPARSGCDTKITNLLTKNYDYLPKKIIYVSCNLATLQRDLNIIKNNYEIKNVCGFDMFPQTKHIETLVVLEKI